MSTAFHLGLEAGFGLARVEKEAGIGDIARKVVETSPADIGRALKGGAKAVGSAISGAAGRGAKAIGESAVGRGAKAVADFPGKLGLGTSTALGRGAYDLREAGGYALPPERVSKMLRFINQKMPWLTNKAVGGLQGLSGFAAAHPTAVGLGELGLGAGALGAGAYGVKKSLD